MTFALMGDNAIISELSSATGLKIEPVELQIQANNSHYVGRRGLDKFFIKLYRRKGRFAVENTVSPIVKELNIPTPALLRSGELHSGLSWAIYEWLDMRPFKETPCCIQSAAKVLSKLHHQQRNVVDGLKNYSSIWDRITQKIALVHNFNDDLARRIEDIFIKIPKKSFPKDLHNVILHGDFGWRNLALSDNDDVIVYDFEHSATGPFYMDFGKMWDRELADAEKRNLFISAYLNEDKIDVAWWDSVMMPTRLWIAAGIFPYTHEKGDKDFEAHGYSILDNIEDALKMNGV